ncbi:MAG: exonuclease domain-containing protein, partial [Hyphomicrobiales bacterium]
MNPPETSANSGATPLLALGAVALDLETTSMDPALARTVQVGAVRVSRGHVNRDDTLSMLINPGMPVPPVSSAIHGLSDDDLKDAPVFAGVVEALEDYLGGAVLIGHTIGYDLTVLRHEYNDL